jgi:hypothetical protein
VPNWFDLSHQRPHARRLLKRQPDWLDHAWCGIVRLFRIGGIRRGVSISVAVRKSEPRASPEMAMQSVLQKSIPCRHDRAWYDRTLHGLGLRWYTRHHANGLYTSHSGDAEAPGSG